MKGYDTIKSGNARRAREWSDVEMEDIARGDFLRALDKAGIQLTYFESDFLHDFFCARLNWWTPRRRATCDEMRKQYGGRL